MQNFSLALTLLGLTGGLYAISSADVKIEEKIMGPANAGGIYAVSPRGVHVAHAATKGSRLIVAIDGVEGPVFDELFEPHGQSFYSPDQVSIFTASAGGQTANSVSPVIYSPDGAHYAYAGRQGNEYVVIHDGKEVARGPRQALALNYGNLTLSPHGRHVYWDEMATANSHGSWRVMVMGKAGPWSSNNNNIQLVFSADDARYAYTAASQSDSRKQILVIDGQPASYFGANPVFTADGKQLLTIGMPADGKGMQLLVDGKPVATGIQISKVVPGPVGRRYAAIVRAKIENNRGVDVLFLDGKEVSGTDGAQNVWFSPDGKHYAVACVNAASRAAFMIIDGKKGPEYQNVSGMDPVWTPDSTRLIYLASNGGRNVAVVDGQESEGFEYLQGLLRPKIVLAEKSNRYAYSTFNGMNRVFSVVVDGKSVLPASLAPVGDTLAFSADGSRYAYAVGAVGRSDVSGLIVDGTLLTGIAPYTFGKFPALSLATDYFLFSPDGKHLAHKGMIDGDQKKTGLILDGHLVHPTQRGIIFPAFTPDSNHLFWVASEVHDRPQPYFVVYVDGQPTVRSSEDAFMKTAGGWEMGRDGVLTFLAVADDIVKRYRITPAAETNIANFITDSAAAQAKAVAEAKAAEAKAIADAEAAKAKADADRAAAAAKAKADYDAAVAAKAKARADAVAAKAKARADAIAAKAAAAAARKK